MLDDTDLTNTTIVFYTESLTENFMRQDENLDVKLQRHTEDRNGQTDIITEIRTGTWIQQKQLTLGILIRNKLIFVILLPTFLTVIFELWVTENGIRFLLCVKRKSSFWLLKCRPHDLTTDTIVSVRKRIEKQSVFQTPLIACVLFGWY